MPSPWSFTFEPLFVLLAAAAVVLYVRAWRRSPGAGRGAPGASGPASRSRARAELAARDDRDRVPRPLPPAPERDDRRRGAAAPPIGLTPAVPRDRRPGRSAGSRRSRGRRSRCPPARRLVRRAPRRGIRRASADSGPARGRACVPDRDRTSSSGGRCSADVPHSGPRRRFGRIGYVLVAFVVSAFPRARVHVLAARLRLLRVASPAAWDITAVQDQTLGASSCRRSTRSSSSRRSSGFSRCRPEEAQRAAGRGAARRRAAGALKAMMVLGDPTRSSAGRRPPGGARRRGDLPGASGGRADATRSERSCCARSPRTAGRHARTRAPPCGGRRARLRDPVSGRAPVSRLAGDFGDTRGRADHARSRRRTPPRRRWTGPAPSLRRGAPRARLATVGEARGGADRAGARPPPGAVPPAATPSARLCSA